MWWNMSPQYVHRSAYWWANSQAVVGGGLIFLVCWYSRSAMESESFGLNVPAVHTSGLALSPSKRQAWHQNDTKTLRQYFPSVIAAWSCSKHQQITWEFKVVHSPLPLFTNLSSVSLSAFAKSSSMLRFPIPFPQLMIYGISDNAPHITQQKRLQNSPYLTPVSLKFENKALSFDVVATVLLNFVPRVMVVVGVRGLSAIQIPRGIWS